ncbi:MAG: hypothetical protein JRG76_12470 [Deltaproteobacteria bacterium]|nr:hypothetical protein [Deltaproteobacteria bacterium]MBW2415313.1 hypothetical protein [Deltaproteobacteria bacterium]
MVATALAIGAVPATADAAPDVDGAVSALIALPFDFAGNALGALGLLTAGTGGVIGDIVAVVDNNEYSSILLRGLLSTPIKRLSMGIGQLSTGGMEGLRGEDFADFPQDASTYLGKDSVMQHMGSFGDGLGAVGLIVVDTLSNTGLFLTRAVGANETAGSLEGWQDDMRDSFVGKATSSGNAEKTMLFD